MNADSHPNLANDAAIDCRPLIVVPETPISQAVKLMSHGQEHDAPATQDADSVKTQIKRSSYLLVIQQEKLLGILTERDVVKMTAQGRDFSTGTVADVMTRQLITLQESDLQHPFSALVIFQKHHIRHLPILTEQGHVIGVATPSSIRRTLQATDLFRLRQVDEVMSTHLITASPESRVIDLARLMATHRVSCVVIGQQNLSNLDKLSPIGIVTERDIVQFQTMQLDLKALQAQAVMSSL